VLLDAYRRKQEAESLMTDPKQDEVIAALQEVIDDLGAQPKKTFFRKKKTVVKGLYIWGGVGRGKTMLMDLFFENLPLGLPKCRTHFHEFMIDVHNDLHRARQAGEVESALPKFAETMAKKCRVLCFDEFHVTDIADAMILGRLFTALFNHGVVVIATSNWPPQRLYEGGLQRDRFLPFIAVLMGHVTVVELDNQIDYRLLSLIDTGTYFYPLGEAARQKAQGVFLRLTDNAAPQQEILTVKGRTIEVAQTARGVARFSFAQLCENPHGAEDFLTIARAYHTVLLEGIPKLGYDRRNEAKRLMTLVDALYDNDVKLIVTADAPPEGLYRGHDHEFEFQRTVSRLVEMQSPSYIEK